MTNKTTDNIQITTSPNMPNSIILQLKGFKNFLEKKIIASAREGINDLADGDDPDESWTYFEIERFKGMVEDCIDYITHIDALLQGEKE